MFAQTCDTEKEAIHCENDMLHIYSCVHRPTFIVPQLSDGTPVSTPPLQSKKLETSQSNKSYLLIFLSPL